MRILELIYGLKPGGAEKFIVNLSNEFIRQGHEVVLCTTLNPKLEDMDFNKQFLMPQVNYINLGYERGFNPKIARDLENIINRYKPDILHCHLNIVPYLFKIACRKPPIIFQTLHNIAENTYDGGWLMRKLLRYYYRSNKIRPIAISKECEKTYECHFNSHSIPYINNGIPKIVPTPRIEEVRREILKLKNNLEDIIFIHVARFHPQKNQELLIRAFNELNRYITTFQLIVIGSGFDSSSAESLRKSACSRIHFLGLKPNVEDYLLCADAFCLTSLYEGLPLSLLEAMSAGCVPICTPAGGIKDVVNSDIGYLTKSFELNDYVNLLRHYISKNTISRSAISDYFETTYSIRSCANKYLTLFQCAK